MTDGVCVNLDLEEALNRMMSGLEEEVDIYKFLYFFVKITFC